MKSAVVVVSSDALVLNLSLTTLAQEGVALENEEIGAKGDVPG